jgi:SET domain-containing protein
MLFIKTKLDKSLIAGIGLIADQFIPKGTLIWRFEEGFDIRYESNYPDKLPEIAKEYFLSHAYNDPAVNKWVMCGDDAKYINHSDNPNVIVTEERFNGETLAVASRDIAVGEELTINYRSFDSDPFYGFNK